MGNDGGSIPKRRELVREGAKELSTTQVKETQHEKQVYYWAHCALSQQPLSLPIVSDSTGNLYNKDAVLESLIETTRKEATEENVAGSEQTSGTIKSLRDVVEVRFQVEEDEKTERSEGSVTLRLICPITKKRLGPGVRAVYIVPCGHAFAESAVKEMGGTACLQCNEPYSADNVIPILPSSTAEEDRLKDRLLKLKEQGITHSLKKAPGSGKKRKKNHVKKEEDEATADITADAVAGPSIPATAHLITKTAATNAIKNQGTASLTAKVLAEQDDRNKRRKMVPNENLKTLFSSGSTMAQKQTDFMTRGFTIPEGARR
ncbi:MAG: hypothetical protein Q9167_000653 [Letrouitia subvulpina]